MDPNSIMRWHYIGDFFPSGVGLYAYPFDIWPYVLLNLLVFATGTVAGLACVWAGLGKPHWFWRIALVTVAASLALLISAHELLIWFFAQAIVTIPPLLIVRCRNARRESADGVSPGEKNPTPQRWLQWSLGSQLLACLLVSGFVAMAVQIRSEVWESWLSPTLLGLMFGLSTLVGTWAAFSKRRLWLRLAAICLLPPSALVAGWLGVFKTFRRYKLRQPPCAWPASMTATVLLLYSVLLLALPTTLFCPLIYPVPIPILPEPPNPNGFDDLVGAGRAVDSELTLLWNAGKIADATWRDPQTGADLELRDLTSATAEALALARSGLERPCRVPFSFSDPLAARIESVQPSRMLQMAFSAEGELARREGRIADAAGSYVDMIRAGYAISRGGDDTDFLLGARLLVRGAARLHDIRSELDSTHCAEMAKRIDRLESEVEPWVEFRERCVAHETQWGGWQNRVTDRIYDLERKLHDGFRSVHAKPRLVICSLALQAYYTDHDAWPKRLADLTPKYLPNVPDDPFTGQPIVYQSDGPGYQLYCLPPETADWDDERRAAFNFSYEGGNE